MHRPLSDLPAGLTLATEPYGGDGPRWVVAQAEAELVARYGGLDDGERGLTAAMFDPPAGAFLVARRGDAAGPPVGGVGVRAVGPDVGEIRRLWVDPDWRGQGIGRALMERRGGRRPRPGPGRPAPRHRRPPARGGGPLRSTGWEQVPTDGRVALPLRQGPVVTTEGRALRDRLRNRAGDHAGPHPRPPPDRRAEPGRHHVPHPRQPHRAGDSVERRRGIRGAADGRALHRLPQRPRPQPARLPARPADGGGLRRGPVPLRLRRRAAGRRPHQRAHGADHAHRGTCLRRDPRRRGCGWRSPAGGPAMRFGAATGLRPLPAWKQAADFLCVQIGFSLDDLLAWRASVAVGVPVYAGVIVVASAGMARNLTIPGLTVPPELVRGWRRATATPASMPPATGGGHPRLGGLRRRAPHSRGALPRGGRPAGAGARVAEVLRTPPWGISGNRGQVSRE